MTGLVLEILTHLKIRMLRFGMQPNDQKFSGGNVCPGQGVIFPVGVRVFSAGNLQTPQEILTKTLIIEQIL